MPRRFRRPEPAGSGGPAGSGVDRIEQWRGEEYLVRSITGSATTKSYRCPGCDQLIRLAMPHLVAWPAHDRGAEYRRHWHTACWAARDRRRPAR